jgi:DNA-directed RNA polymerase subunit RPC12/RpoP
MQNVLSGYQTLVLQGIVFLKEGGIKMIYRCKNCGKEISLFEIDFEGEAFCECGGMEMIFLRTGEMEIRE